MKFWVSPYEFQLELVLQWGKTGEGNIMQLPTVFSNSSFTSLPPMYAWPRYVKRTLLGLAVVSVLVAYVLLAGGIVTVLAMLAEVISF